MKFLTKKQQDEIIKRLIANTMISQDALKRAFICDRLSLEEYRDGLNHLADNAINLADAIAGSNGLSKMNEILGIK